MTAASPGSSAPAAVAGAKPRPGFHLESSQILSRRFLGHAERACQRKLGEIVRVQAANQLSVAPATASWACTTSRLFATPAAKRSWAWVQLLAGEVRGALRDLDPLVRRGDVEQRRPHLELDARSQVLELRLLPAQLRVGLEQAPLDPAALEDRHVDHAPTA